MIENRYDVVVVGGGHAGVEVALISDFLGASVAIITMDTNAISRMSCTPLLEAWQRVKWLEKLMF